MQGVTKSASTVPPFAPIVTRMYGPSLRTFSTAPLNLHIKAFNNEPLLMLHKKRLSIYQAFNHVLRGAARTVLELLSSSCQVADATHKAAHFAVKLLRAGPSKTSTL
jgi:hypothetical protein